MATKQPSAALTKVLKLADNVSENRIELALALADLEEKKPGSIADLAKTRPKERRMLYYLLKSADGSSPWGSRPHVTRELVGPSSLSSPTMPPTIRVSSLRAQLWPGQRSALPRSCRRS